MRNRFNDLNNLSLLLDMTVIGETYEYGATYEINNYQSLYIRLEGGQGGKGYALVSCRKDKVFNDLLVNSNDFSFYGTKIDKIQFNKDKDISKIANDISKRLLNNPMVLTQYHEIEGRITNDNSYYHSVNNRKEFLKLEGYDISEYRGGEAEIYQDDISVNIKIENSEINIRHLSTDNFRAIAKLLMTFKKV